MPRRACGQAQSSARDRGSSERRGSSTAGHWPSLVCHTHHPTATIATCAARWWHTECPSCSNSSITSTVTFTTGKAQQRQTQTRIDYSCAGANAPRLVTVIVTVLNVMRSIRFNVCKIQCKILGFNEHFKIVFWADERHGKLATLPQGNQELLVVRDKVGRPQGSQVHGRWYFSLQCFDTVGWATGRASGL